MCPSGAANACLLAGSRSGDGWRQASDDPWGQDRDAGRADGAWRVWPVVPSSAATRGGRIAAGWCASARRSGPWGCGRRMARGAPRLGWPAACPSACVARGLRAVTRRAGAFLARASPVARQSHPWGCGHRMARGGGRPIHPVARSPAVARASQAVCSTARPPV